jgi:hypothetical protein
MSAIYYLLIFMSVYFSLRLINQVEFHTKTKSGDEGKRKSLLSLAVYKDCTKLWIRLQ